MDQNGVQNLQKTPFHIEAKSQKRWLSKSPTSPFVLCIGITVMILTQQTSNLWTIRAPERHFYWRR